MANVATFSICVMHIAGIFHPIWRPVLRKILIKVIIELLNTSAHGVGMGRESGKGEGEREGESYVMGMTTFPAKVKGSRGGEEGWKWGRGAIKVDRSSP